LFYNLPEHMGVFSLGVGLMKSTLIAFSGLGVLMSGIVYAQTETPVIDQRQTNQEHRIDQGIASGQLSEREARRLDRQQDHIDRMEDRAKSDGIVTRKERARIGAAQNRSSRHILKEKHDRQGVRHR
jgi:opacity protein-like surface antigen